MNRIILLAIVCFFITAASGQPANDVLVPNGYLNGNRYLSLGEERQIAYVMGVIDGLLASVIFGGDAARVNALQNCILEMQGSQALTIVNKYLDGSPQNWHHPMSTQIYIAFTYVCPEIEGISSPTASIFLPSVCSL